MLLATYNKSKGSHGCVFRTVWTLRKYKNVCSDARPHCTSQSNSETAASSLLFLAKTCTAQQRREGYYSPGRPPRSACKGSTAWNTLLVPEIGHLHAEVQPLDAGEAQQRLIPAQRTAEQQPVQNLTLRRTRACPVYATAARGGFARCPCLAWLCSALNCRRRMP